MKCQVVLVFATILGLLTASASADDGQFTGPVLQVIRLKPGESKRIELALPFGRVQFRPGGASGRTFLYLETLPMAEGGVVPAKGKSINHDVNKVYELTTGVRLAWVADRPEIEVRADAGAKSGTTDVKLRYETFGGGTYVSGYRVVVESK